MSARSVDYLLGRHGSWSWRITKLKGPGKCACFHRYAILDVFSRYVVGRTLAPRELAALTDEPIHERRSPPLTGP